MGLLSDFLRGVDDLHPKIPQPVLVTQMIRLDELIYGDDNITVTGIKKEVFERVAKNISAFERGHRVKVHDWSILFPPTVYESRGLAVIQVEYMVTR
jgi:hypothetical protein